MLRELYAIDTATAEVHRGTRNTEKGRTETAVYVAALYKSYCGIGLR
jgi:hypothetical protein